MLASLALQARVRVALKEDSATREIDVHIEASQGQVVLEGIVASAEERARAEQVASGVAGVAGVENRLRLMTMPRLFPSAKQT
jgi:osmotically-inducible protein OsmY